jgi:hypothetical protein
MSALRTMVAGLFEVFTGRPVLKVATCAEFSGPIGPCGCDRACPVSLCCDTCGRFLMVSHAPDAAWKMTETSSPGDHDKIFRFHSFADALVLADSIGWHAKPGDLRCWACSGGIN